MGKDYVSFSAEDFAADELFQKWVLQKDKKASCFWENWLENNPDKKQMIELSKHLVSQFRYKSYEASEADFMEVWEGVKKQNIKTRKINRFRVNSLFIGRVAAAVVVLLVSIVGYTSFFEGEDVERKTMQQAIVGGVDKALLTVENDSVIFLEEGKTIHFDNLLSNGKQLVYEGRKTNKEEVYHYLTVPRGGKYYVQLSDGTEVWLNSESQLKYPVSFSKGKVRQVELAYGEAYFKVSPSVKHDGANFKVKHDLQEIEVLGTEFNVKAYKDEALITTTLVEGSIKLTTKDKQLLMKPDESFEFNVSTDGFKLNKEVDVYRHISWKQDKFSFRDKPLKEIMLVLSRWYDFEFSFEDKSIKEERFSGTINKNLDVREVMSVLISSSKLKYKIKNKVISISKIK